LRVESPRRREISILLLVAVAITSGFFNALDEELARELLIRFTIYWSIGPLIVLVAYLLSVLFSKSSSLNYREAALLAILYAGVHVNYALNGPSWRKGPDNAAQMHLVFVPFVLGFVATVVVCLMIWNIIRARRDSSTSTNKGL
jgi:hypothetical protein